MSHNLQIVPLHGWINLYKPKGISSAKVLNVLKKFLPRKYKIGHAGTLDPLAEGVLPVAIGEATKTIPYIQGDNKEYLFQITWGESRSTGDAEGEIISSSPLRPTYEQLKKILPEFTGEIQQIPPLYSALKVNGIRAYELARQGKNIILASRNVQIHSLEIINHVPEEKTVLRVYCSKGTYVRSLATDIAKKSGADGYVSSLVRTRVGAFLQKDSIYVEKLVASDGKDLLCSSLRSIVEVLDDILAINVDEQDAQYLRQGRIIQAQSSEKKDSEIALCIRSDSRIPIAIVKNTEQGLVPIRVFNIDT